MASMSSSFFSSMTAASSHRFPSLLFDLSLTRNVSPLSPPPPSCSKTRKSSKPSSSTKRRPTDSSSSSLSSSLSSLSPSAQHAAKLANMRQLSSEEKLLFSPLPASPSSLSCIYAYPNEYSVGICSLGYQIMWRQLSQSENCHVSRLFTDASDPLPQTPELVGFSLSWELDYVGFLGQLSYLGISLEASERGEGDPIVFAGGTVMSCNPEPYSTFLDVVLVGDGEELLGNFLAAVEATRGGGGTREERLRAMAQVPGVYVPSLYEVEYTSVDGPIAAIRTVHSDVPQTVTRQTYRGDRLASSSVVSPKMAWENIFMLEVVRSCPEMCRFCLASYSTLPFRIASVETSLLPAVEEGLKYTSRIGLLGASVTQHPQFDRLLEHLLQPSMAEVRLSIASVRTNTVTPKLAAALATRGTRSLTVAVESGSSRMRKIVNKKLEQEEIVTAAINAQEGGLKSLKLYAMVGLPGEEDSDIEKTIEMMKDLKKAAPRLRFSLGCSTFVPKAQTPFQWCGVRPEAEKRMKTLTRAMGAMGVEFRPESYKWSVVQAALSRGDRRLSPLLLRASGYGEARGAIGRAWREMKGTLPSMDYYSQRQMGVEGEVLPWDHIVGSALPAGTLVRHYRQAEELWLQE